MDTRMMQLQALNLIAGEWRPAQSGAWAHSFDPSNAKPLGRFAASARADGQVAIDAARAAFEQPQWSQNPRLRQLVMLRWADRMEARTDELAQLLTRENGKVLAQSRGEIAAAVSEIRYYAGLTRYMPGHVFEVEPGSFSTVIKEPAGVAGIIVPWNAPAVLLIRSLTPALAAGCTTVIKPAPQTALITAALIDTLHGTDGLPPGVVNLVSEEGHEVAALLTESPEVDALSFTGSNGTGQRIMAAAAPTMKKLSLELGGKSACLVFEDADVNAVAPAIAAAATIISGQQCTAARRVLVHGSRYDAMKRALASALSGMNVAPGLQAGAQIGPMIDEASASRRPWTPPTRWCFAARVGRVRWRAVPSSRPPWWRTATPAPSSCRKKSSARCWCSSASRTRPRPCGAPTTPSSVSPPVCGRAMARAACAWRARCAMARSGSTTTTSCSPRPRPVATAAVGWVACTATTP
jgi:betaine-aldehyde dehydrogenase